MAFPRPQRTSRIGGGGRRGLGATSSIQDLINQSAAKYNLSPTLLYSVAKTESNLNPNAVSPQGAQGVMQLMPGTAAQLGVTNPFDPAQNIDGGAKYLSQLLTQYNGDTTLALAAYNAGPGNVAKYGGVPPFAETQNYISTVMAGAGEPQGSTSPVPSVDLSTLGTDSTGSPVDPGMSIPDASVLSGGTDPTLIAVGIAAGVALLAYTLG